VTDHLGRGPFHLSVASGSGKPGSEQSDVLACARESRVTTSPRGRGNRGAYENLHVVNRDSHVAGRGGRARIRRNRGLCSMRYTTVLPAALERSSMTQAAVRCVANQEKSSEVNLPRRAGVRCASNSRMTATAPGTPVTHSALESARHLLSYHQRGTKMRRRKNQIDQPEAIAERRAERGRQTGSGAPRKPTKPAAGMRPITNNLYNWTATKKNWARKKSAAAGTTRSNERAAAPA